MFITFKVGMTSGFRGYLRSNISLGRYEFGPAILN